VKSNESIELDHLFRLLDCNLLVVFEDELVNESRSASRGEILYDILKMDENDRVNLLQLIEAHYHDLSASLESFCRLCSLENAAVPWDEVIREDFERDLSRVYPGDEKEVVRILEEVSTEELQDACANFMARYGIAQKYSGCYTTVLDTWKKVDTKEPARPVRIYEAFESERENFLEDIEAYGEEGVICILDDRLGGQSESDEIISLIESKANEGDLPNIIGVIFSAGPVASRYSESVYFERIGKQEPERIVGAFAKSSYAAYLRRLRALQRQANDEAYKMALQNPSVAAYLAERSVHEGLSEHQVIADWINALSHAQVSQAHDLSRLKALAQVINKLEDCEDDQAAVDELERFESYGAFDYQINGRCEPIALGDVFRDDNDKEAYYVLVGQECDLAKRGGQERKERIASLLKAKVVSRNKTVKKIGADSFETIVFDSFLESIEADSVPKLISVACGRAYYRQFEVLDLCSFNENGRCAMSLNDGIDPEVELVIPSYQAEYFDKLSEYFNMLKRVGEEPEKLFPWEKEWASKLEIEEGEVRCSLTRICRMNREYAAHIRSVHLAHKGRQGYGLSDVSRWHTLNVILKYGSQEVEVPISIFRPVRLSGSSSLQKLPWFIEGKYLQQEKMSLSDLEFDQNVIYNDKVLLNSQSGLIGTVKGTKIHFEKKHATLEIIR